MIITIDDYSDNFEELKLQALTQHYQDYNYQGYVFPDISKAQKPLDLTKIEKVLGKKLTFSQPTFFREYKSVDRQPTYIHTDYGSGEYTSILYLNEQEDCYGGTAFWRHKKLDQTKVIPNNTSRELELLQKDTYDESRWELLNIVTMKPNMLLLFKSELFHSRYPYELKTNQSPRLIQVSFLNEQR